VPLYKLPKLIKLPIPPNAPPAIAPPIKPSTTAS